MPQNSWVPVFYFLNLLRNKKNRAAEPRLRNPGIYCHFLTTVHMADKFYEQKNTFNKNKKNLKNKKKNTVFSKFAKRRH